MSSENALRPGHGPTASHGVRKYSPDRGRSARSASRAGASARPFRGPSTTQRDRGSLPGRYRHIDFRWDHPRSAYGRASRSVTQCRQGASGPRESCGRILRFHLEEPPNRPHPKRLLSWNWFEHGCLLFDGSLSFEHQGSGAAAAGDSSGGVSNSPPAGAC